MTPKKLTAIAAALLAATLTLTACGGADDPEPTTAPTQGAEPTTEPTEAESPEPTEEPAPEGMEYTLADGTTVAIDPAAPLPDEVVADLRAQASFSPSAIGTTAELDAALMRAMDAIENVEALGKRAYVVSVSGGYDSKGNLIETYFASTVYDPEDPLYTDDAVFQDHATALKVAQERVAGAPNPNDYVILDLVG